MDPSSYRSIPLFPSITKLENNIIVPCHILLPFCLQPTGLWWLRVTGLWLWPQHDTKTFSRYQRPPFYQIQWSVLDVSLFDFSAVFPIADDCLFKYFIHLASRINFFLVCLHLTCPPIFITLLFLMFPSLTSVVPGVWLLTFSLPSLLFCFLPIHILPSFLMLSFSLLSYTLDPC